MMYIRIIESNIKLFAATAARSDEGARAAIVIEPNNDRGRTDRIIDKMHYSNSTSASANISC